MGQHTTPRSDAFGLERITAFSDGVFAIAITVLVLPLTDAELAGDRIGEQLGALIPEMLTFALSFAVIGRYWIVHHRMFDRFVRGDRMLVTLNLGYLCGIAFLPFPTSVLGEHGGTAAVLLYAANLIVIGLASTAIWWHGSSGGRLTVPEVTPAGARASLARALSGVLGFLPSVPIAFASPTAAMLSWLLVVPVSMLVDRAFPGPAV